MLKRSPSQIVAVYHPAFRTIHWLMALLIFVALGLGVWRSLLAKGDLRSDVMFVHKSVGFTILALVAVRIVARLALGSPAEAEPPGLVAGLAARGGHLLLYALMIALPLTGWVSSSAGEHDLPFFGLFSLPPIVGADKALAEQASQAHYLFAWAIGAVIALHLAAVVWHAWIRRDTVLTRMWPRFVPSAR